MTPRWVPWAVARGIALDTVAVLESLLDDDAERARLFPRVDGTPPDGPEGSIAAAMRTGKR